MMQFPGRIATAASPRSRPSTALTGTHCRSSNVIVAHWRKPGAGKHGQVWYYLTCRTTLSEQQSPA